MFCTHCDRMNCFNRKELYRLKERSGWIRDIHYKWMVLVSGFLAFCIGVGFILSIGALLLEVMATFDVTRPQAVAVQSASWAVYQLAGVLNGSIVSRFGPRKSGLFGSFLLSFGIAISFIAPSVIFLYFSISLCLGLGSSLLYISASTAQGQHFVGKNKDIPLSFFMAGSSVGSVIWTYLLVKLIDIFGLRGALLLSSGILMNCIPASLLWTAPVNKQVGENKKTPDSERYESNKQIHHSSTVSENKEESDLNIFSEESITTSPIKEELQLHIEHHVGNSANPDNTDYSSEELSEIQNAPAAIKAEDRASNKDIDHNNTLHVNNNVSVTVRNSDTNLSDVIESRTPSDKLKDNESKNVSTVLSRTKTVLTNKVFMAFNVANMISVQCIELYLFFSFDIFADRGFDENAASVAVIVFSCTAIVGRVCFGPLLKIPYITTLGLLIIAAVINLAGITSLLFVQSYPLLVLVSAVIGFASGLVFSSWVVATLKLVGKEHLSNAVGVLMTTVGIVTAASGPITGYIRDQTGSYRVSLIIIAVSTVVAILILCYAQWMRTDRCRKRSD